MEYTARCPTQKVRMNQRGGRRGPEISLIRARSFVVEDLVEGHAEHPRDLKGHLERRRVATLLDRDDGLARDPDPIGQFGLGHLAVLEAEASDLVGDPGRLDHDQKPRR